MEIDYSQLSTYQTCPMKYYLKYKMGLKKRVLDERDIDRTFGQCVHSGLEKYYKGEHKNVLSSFDSFEDLPEDAKENHKTKANGISLLRAYVEHYDKLDKDMEVLDVETVEKSQLSSVKSGAIYIGKVDTIVRLRENVFVLEHKTTKKIGYSYFNHYSPNMQISGYTWLTAKKYGHCSGVIINAMQSGYRSRAYRGEPAGFHCAFQREIVNRTKEQLEDFEKNVGLVLDKLNNECDWCKNEINCHTYRGCTYKEICMTSIGRKLDSEIVETLYERVDPYAYLKEDK